MSSAVLDWLKQGNERFLGVLEREQDQYVVLNRDQRPRAIILGCADSRTSPEFAFDTRLGELFVVRVAGNVAGRETIASIEYAVENLGVGLIVVFAHESCGAVTAALEGGDAGKNLKHLIKRIRPAVEELGTSEVDAVARRSAQINAERMVRKSDVLREAAERGELEIVTAFFHFATGEVEFY
jgi:carbonic anhydrase